MKDLMNQKSFSKNDIERKHEECVVIKENQKAYNLEKTHLRAKTAIFDQYENLFIIGLYYEAWHVIL